MSAEVHLKEQPDGWRQLGLFPPEVVTITLRVGIMVRDDHLQWQVEVRDGKSDALAAMVSRPHAGTSALLAELELAQAAVLELARQVVEPF